VFDTVKLRYTEIGQGTPVILLHGFPLSGAIWTQQQRELGDKFRVIVPDLRGHGTSPAPDGPYEMSRLARDVFELLNELRIERAVWLGHSMGGYVTLAGWNLAPQRFLGLGLVASHAAADTEEVRQGRFRLAEQVAAQGTQVAADGMLPKLFSPQLAADDPIVDQVRQLIQKTSPAGIAATLHAMATRADSTPLLPKIQVPTLVLAGDQDTIIPLARAETTAAAMPNSTLAIVEAAGHMPMLEQPAATTAALRQFLSEIKD
jgi:pimeloyl-ACP methyl ester carboxylesterase